ncbi:DUF3019 domain-containing protein [Pseudoalteromonas sp. OOF1S-7]|uniref:DUF3019 domain-containing protein n=1 Tax=Pseudoalteromonas sp. OOF1S-7 TaxID=2917757 RepID=UPI001EF45279|nr:DUF3019 domain-containing protein [Pseudoalteromonas sp. OOF1S-7]MCG7534392.1 DUF3019 domain-containing protein [Pseudoalteromonas sp. OOF1S-7]
MHKFIFTLAFTGITLVHYPADASTPVTLTLSPQQCVALHQGEYCHSELTLHWQADTQGHYCLTQSNREQPLKCWQKTTAGTLTLALKFNQNVRFALQDNQQNTLASTQLTYAWVYNKSKNTRVRWRMF